MNILTIDLEDWFHILDHSSTSEIYQWEKFESRIERNTDWLLQVMSDSNVQATFFILGWVAEKYPGLVKKIISNGHEPATHSYAHQLLYKQNAIEMKNDLQRAIQLTEDVCGKKITAYRAPGFSFNQKSKFAFEVLNECGIEMDCSLFPARRNHGGFHQFGKNYPVWIEYEGYRLKELPINTKNVFGQRVVFSGGGYFRFFNYKHIQRWMKSSDYVMTYFHPRDFDSGQPMIEDLVWYRKWMSYTGLKSSASKFQQFLKDFSFVTVGEANANINWSDAETVKFD